MGPNIYPFHFKLSFQMPLLLSVASHEKLCLILGRVLAACARGPYATALRDRAAEIQRCFTLAFEGDVASSIRGTPSQPMLLTTPEYPLAYVVAVPIVLSWPHSFTWSVFNQSGCSGCWLGVWDTQQK